VVRVGGPRPIRAAPASVARRPLTSLSASRAGRYTELVAAVAGAVETALSSRVAAHRLADHATEPTALRFVPWLVERAAFSARLAAMAATHPCLVFTDVRDCYGSIRPAVVRDALASLGADPIACDRLRGFLDGLADRGVRGLPVGPAPSAVLANAVLAVADRALERWGVPYLRWVDDVVAGTPDRAAAERVVAGLAVALGRVGLALNESKTRIVVDPAAEGLAVRASMGGRAVVVG
jgi:hypothetical protein